MKSHKMDLNVNVDLDAILAFVAANVAKVAIVANAAGIILVVGELFLTAVVVASKIYHIYVLLFIKDGIKKKLTDNNKE